MATMTTREYERQVRDVLVGLLETAMRAAQNNVVELKEHNGATIGFVLSFKDGTEFDVSIHRSK